MSKTITVLVGHWSLTEKDKSNLPFPIADSWHPEKMASKKRFLKWLKDFLSQENVQTLCCKGSSKCRICGKKNGSEEHRIIINVRELTMRIIIPEGYPHYIEDHDVKPPLQFFRQIARKNYADALKYTKQVPDSEKYIAV